MTLLRVADVREEDKETTRYFFNDPLTTEQGQGEGITLQGILGRGTSTRCTGIFVYDIIGHQLLEASRMGGEEEGKSGPRTCLSTSRRTKS
jgi:hypothetical protein